MNSGSDYVAVAANATLKHSGARVDRLVLEHEGPKIPNIIATIASKDLNVEALQTYREVMAQVVSASATRFPAPRATKPICGRDFQDFGPTPRSMRH